jgi:phosphohistidine phosphatase
MSSGRRLYLLRHAKSSWDQEGLADHDRPLADRGQQAVRILAEHVRRLAIDPELILCSSAVRTRETLAGVLPGRAEENVPGRGVEIERDLFTAGADQLLERLRQIPADVSSVMVIGHNPSMQVLTLRLAAGEAPHRPAGAEGLAEIRRKLPTGALVTLDLDAPWSELAPGSAVLVDYARPKALLLQRR